MAPHWSWMSEDRFVKWRKVAFSEDEEVAKSTWLFLKQMTHLKHTRYHEFKDHKGKHWKVLELSVKVKEDSAAVVKPVTVQKQFQ